MIFAHGPLGFVTTLTLRNAWIKRYPKKRRFGYWLLAIGWFGAIFPDVDLLYFYLHNASGSHRDFITHTPILYLGVLVVGCLIAWLTKNTKLLFATFAFTLGTATHLLTDTVIGQIKIFYPFSYEFYGIADFHRFSITTNLLFFNFLLEGICFFFFFYACLRLFVHNRRTYAIVLSVLLLVFAAGVWSLMQLNNHVYHGPHNGYFDDSDADGQDNYVDLDMDGDGVRNTDDIDSDGDEKSNAQEIIENSQWFLPVWYDKSEGGFIQIPERLGLITTIDMPSRLYGTVGVYIKEELQDDYAHNPNGYVLPPTDENFDRNSENFRTWFAHRGRLETEPMAGRNQIGDMLFLQSGHIVVVSGFTLTGETLVLDVHKNRDIHEVSLESLNDQVIARGKMFLTQQ
ncbi:MAG: metal-dependent hydrolase [Candidatus Kerfeldbacteria bacterium]|nr:metal-dependent hydrolase [Candidatus Kerfeldbacteria bacterium]